MILSNFIDLLNTIMNMKSITQTMTTNTPTNTTTTVTETPPDTTENTYALVCGCDYQGGWRVYQSYNDAVKFNGILIDTYKICPNNIRTLYNAEYTRSNILKELNMLASKLDSPGKTGIVYVAGHGTQTRDSNGDEADGFDENWQTYDRMNIVDDEITKIFEQTHKDCNLTIISDCCHSGSMLDIEDDRYTDRRWLSIGSALDSQSALQSGDGSVCSVELFKILGEDPTIKMGCLRDVLMKRMGLSFIGDMQSCVVSISNPKLWNNNIFSYL